MKFEFCLLFLLISKSLSVKDTFPLIIEGEDFKNELGKALKTLTDYKGQELPDYSGDGFVYLESTPISYELEVNKGGMYSLFIRVAQFVDKESRTETVKVNDIQYQMNIPHSEEWIDFDFGLIKLKDGKNKISFLTDRGYLAIDKITLDLPDYPDLKLATSKPCDPKATKEAKTLMKYLHSIYGEHILSGQQEIYGGGHGGNFEQEMDYISNFTGKFPAIRGFDIANFNIMYGWNDKCWDRAVKWWEEGGILTCSYHLHVPTDWENYTVGEHIEWSNEAVTYKNVPAFSIKNAVKEGTKENDFINGNIAKIAAEFLKMQEKGIPILWRPFHEAQGHPELGNSFFWWGQEGPKPFKQLWIYLFKQLTEEYGIHNLLWVNNLYYYNEQSADWYPGDEYVDIVAYDKYNVVWNRHDGKTEGPNEDAESRLFYGLVKFVKNKKMVAMAENDSLPSVENMIAEKAYWLYFNTWYDSDGGGPATATGKDYQDPDNFKELYQSELVITREELPDIASGEIE